jgi:membrane associated rhomboid family serine protease
MPRHPASTYGASFSFGPGPLSTVLKGLIAANVVMFIAQWLAPDILYVLGLQPQAVVEHGRIWQLGTYMFLHGGATHLLFNMLGLWMFGTELERIWGTRYFLKYYFVTGIGAAVLTVVASLFLSAELYQAWVIGASGAIYGLLLAYGLYFPDRPIYMYLVFPIPAKYFVMIMGAFTFYMSMGRGSGVAHLAHLGGLVVGYLYLKGGRFQPLGEIKYRYLRWKMNRARRRFDVYAGGKQDRHIH